MKEQKKYKDLPKGIESFNELISEGCYFVDKTPYIKTILENGKRSVLLITRPRRFGKTLFMTMLADFLRINALNPEDKENTKALFKDTVIYKDKDFTDKYLGNYPVISISLKTVDATTYDAAYDQIADVITELVKQLSYLKNSNALSDINKEKFRRLSDIDYIKNQRNIASLGTAIRDVASCLYEHFKRQVIVLIDEYDVPLAKAAEHGFHDDMVSLIISFFNFMKIGFNSFDGSKPIYKIIMTGCLKVTINDFLSGPNNLSVNTVLDDDENFTSMFGFNKSEVIKLLDYYDMSDYKDLVKDNYGGYKFNDDELFCPWDVMNFLDLNHRLVLNNEKDKVEAANYLKGSSSASSTVIKDYLAFLSENDNKNLQDLVDSKTIDVSINDFKNHDSLEMHKADDFYTLLLHTGYLTSVGNPSKNIYSVKIPNREIYDCFKENIMSFFEDCVIKKNTDNIANKIAEALLNGDCNTALAHIRKIISQFVSIRDFATKAYKENYYHALLNGIFACATNIQNYRTNSEAGDGFADIIFESSDGTKAVIIEVKLVGVQKELAPKVQEAIAQIKEKNYAKDYTEDPVFTDVYCYGISFFAKNCYMLADSKE